MTTRPASYIFVRLSDGIEQGPERSGPFAFDQKSSFSLSSSSASATRSQAALK